MLGNTATRIGLLVGLLLGVAASYVGPALATRNSAGTYSLPAGNPVVNGTTISPTTHNNTMSDVATELTNSLDRSGRGAMTGQLQCSVGAVGAPSLTFSGDTDTGFYWIGANNIGLALNGTKVADFSTTTPLALTGAATFSTTVGVTGAQTNAAGITVTQSTSNGTAGTFTGNGTGAAVSCTGGSSSGRGGTFLGGASNGIGLFATGDGTGAGVQSTGGDSDGDAFVGTGGATNGRGGFFTGAGTGDGAKVVGGATGDGLNAAPGGSPTADTNTRYAINVSAGNVKLGGGNPTSTTAFSNTVGASSVAKAWGRINTDGAGNASVANGFNIASVSISGSDLVVNFASAFTGITAYVVVANNGTGANRVIAVTNNTASQAVVSRWNASAGTQDNLGSTSAAINLVAYGLQ